MSNIRIKALEALLSRTPVEVNIPSPKASDYYGINVFNRQEMREYMSGEAYSSVMDAIEKGSTIERRIADQVGAAMKDWAISKGATHYTHWFQPLTGATAEKHDAFFEPVDGGGAIERFHGTQLVQQEPDASSFPSGGIRNTFEARGYTAWDPSSSAFVIGRTLCIPTIFVSYTGEALDFKTPLLKALHALDKAAVDVCQYFDKNVNKVIATLGWEQEYFLVDAALYNARPDLAITGRTLFGLSPAKGQQLEDHYFGSIPERVNQFMRDLEIESHKLAIPVKTRHNEVAPNQFELAPVFEEANLAVDHNQLIMDLMEKIARRHNFRILLHEKPFAGVNGSGKHNNWSMSTNTGVNLLSPGKTPKTNLQFLTFFVNILKAVHDHDDLIRSSIATAGNEHRLGANEAPPAIMSAFIGTQLTEVLDEIENKVKKGKMSPEEKTDLKLNIGKIPQILKDNTDRNRTSPFAFTGNKFEFRAVGSSSNCSGAMIVLNTIMANQLIKFKEEVDTLLNKSINKDEAIFQVLRNYIVESKRIRFEGNGYSQEWVTEAKKRGLNNFQGTPDALDARVSKKTIDVFKKLNILSEREILARHEIELETYSKKIEIESLVIEEMSLNQIIPTAVKYQTALLENVRGFKDVFPGGDFKKLAGSQIATISEISLHLEKIKKNIDEMVKERDKAHKQSDPKKHAKQFGENVKPYFDLIRKSADHLELIVEDELWPLPKYREMLFSK